MSLKASEVTDFAEAVTRLAVARLILLVAPSRCLTLLSPVADPTVLKTNWSMAERITIAIGRAAARVPWRSDCLVQAVAARGWLQDRGVACRLRIGVRDSTPFRPHAWVTVDAQVVIGGDVSGHVEFQSKVTSGRSLTDQSAP